jgi:hypothetical protein
MVSPDWRFDSGAHDFWSHYAPCLPTSPTFVRTGLQKTTSTKDRTDPSPKNRDYLLPRISADNELSARGRVNHGAEDIFAVM